MQEHDFIVGDGNQHHTRASTSGQRPGADGSFTDHRFSDNGGPSASDGDRGSEQDPFATRRAWQEVSDHLAALGSTLREHYVQTGQSETLGDLRDAFEDLSRAANRIGAATGRALHDPAVQAQVRAAMSAVAAAVAHTVGDVSASAAHADG